jgi:hypothetical protein
MGARSDIVMAESFYIEEPVLVCATGDQVRTAGESLGTTVGKTVAKTRELATLISERVTAISGRVTAIREERPLQILAVLAALAFAAGFTARIWRANRNA